MVIFHFELDFDMCRLNKCCLCDLVGLSSETYWRMGAQISCAKIENWMEFSFENWMENDSVYGLANDFTTVNLNETASYDF